MHTVKPLNTVNSRSSKFSPLFGDDRYLEEGQFVVGERSIFCTSIIID